MSDISISADTIQSLSLDAVSSSAEALGDSTSETNSVLESGINRGGIDAMEMRVSGSEVSSRTEDFMGVGTDMTSTGTDPDIREGVNTMLSTGIGTITDRIA